MCHSNVTLRIRTSAFWQHVTVHTGAGTRPRGRPHGDGQPWPSAVTRNGGTVVSVDNFTYGLLNPALAYAMSCVGGYLGLRCVTLARAYTGMARARWLGLAAVAIGAVGIWAMHFIAMLGFSVPGEPILYNVPQTVGSMLLAVAVVGTG